MSCSARIRPLPNDTTIDCELDAHGTTQPHRGVLRNYAHAGSATTITWLADDRRTFHGDWPGRCSHGVPCILPDGHRGNHAS